MPRKPAAERHHLPDDRPSELVDVLIAFHHPTRRWLHEILALEGPASVGGLAGRTGLAVGSVSHHLKPLHQQGFVEPAPELARDTRESWWRVVPRQLSWSADDFLADTPGRLVADRAEVENFRHQVRAVQQWMTRASSAPEKWRRAATSADTTTRATAAQLRDLSSRLQDVMVAWADECVRDAAERPQRERRPVRVVVRTFPTEAVHP
ncbi:ArsR/SmtB family transcription factor [Nocardioides silvaticus]|nr:ArsR family transcriptional regulator [Nocardioides silvaticus]